MPSASRRFLSIPVAAMRRFSIILLLAAALNCSGCESFTRPIKKSFSSAAEDYHRVTTGASSSYIAARGQRQ
jgi:hypothetical protein